MQRLFSMFPAGAAGIGLLMLRVCIAAMILTAAYPGIHLVSITWNFLGLLALCILLCVGLITPAACVLSVLLVVLRVPPTANLQTMHLLLTLGIIISLALLGPGAFSVDAKLFGRRIVSVSPPRNREP